MTTTITPPTLAPTKPTKPQPETLEKMPIEPTGLCIGLLIGTLFTTISLLDLSVSSFGNIPFILQYYIWKANAPILKPLITGITLLVPIALIETVVSIYQTFTRKASKTRHLCDVLNALSFACVIYTNITFMAGYEESILNAALAGKVDTITSEYIASFNEVMVFNVIINVIMLLIPIIRYVEQENTKQSNGVAATVVEVGKKKKD